MYHYCYYICTKIEDDRVFIVRLESTTSILRASGINSSLSLSFIRCLKSWWNDVYSRTGTETTNASQESILICCRVDEECH